MKSDCSVGDGLALGLLVNSGNSDEYAGLDEFAVLWGLVFVPFQTRVLVVWLPALLVSCVVPGE